MPLVARKKQHTHAARIGLLITLLVALLHVLNVFEPIEQRTIDWRFASALRHAEPMDSAIVHVDIDDGSLDRFGRWPWDRSLLADAIDELNAAGAKTIALDLILTEAQNADADDRLAEAVSNARCIVPSVLHGADELGDVWREPGGQRELVALFDLLGSNIQIDAAIAADAARLTGPRRARFMTRTMLFRQAAAWRALRAADDERFATFETFEAAMTPQRTERSGDYPERTMLKLVWAQDRAWRESPMISASDVAPTGGFQDRAPLPEFARAAAGAGFVDLNQSRSGDGAVRLVRIQRDAPGTVAIPFALAAVLLQNDLTIDDFIVDDGALGLGPVRLPLDDGRLWINWPTSATEPKWEGLLRQSESDPPTQGHISIGEVIALAHARRTQQRNHDHLHDVARLVLAYANIPLDDNAAIDAMSLASAADEVDFTLDGMTAQEIELLQQEETDEAVLDHIHNCLQFEEIARAIEEGRDKITKAEAELNDRVEGRLVFLGWTASGASADFVPTAIGGRTPGVVVHAALAHTALTGRGVHILHPILGVAIILLLGVSMSVIGALRNPIASTVLALLVLSAYGALALLVFDQVRWMAPVAGPAIAGGGAWIAALAVQAAITQRQRAMITRQFKARVSSQLVDHLAGDPDALSVDGRQREITILFADLAGFTTIAEALGSAKTVALLNRCMRAITDELIERDAYVNKFLGDGVMAFWSAFNEDPDQADKACRAAEACRKRIAEIGAETERDHDTTLSLRIGVATGMVTVGDCGAPPALHDYTVIGDAVNLAARLESANKQFGSSIVIDGATHNNLRADDLRLRPLGSIVVVGQSTPVDIYELADAGAPDEAIELMAGAVKRLKAGAIDEALAAFDAIENRFGPSEIIRLYLEAIATAGDEFDGVLRLGRK
jgi:class 3 adenylate cyclase